MAKHQVVDFSDQVLKALEDYFAPKEGLEGAIALALKKVEEDPRLPMVEDGIRAFKAIVQHLISSNTDAGFEAWKPPSDSGKGEGHRWKEAVTHIKKCWEDHPSVTL